MEDIKNKDTVSTEEGENDAKEEQTQPCSASKIDRQTSYTKKDTIETDFVPETSLKKQDAEGISSIQEAESDEELNKFGGNKDKEETKVDNEEQKSDLKSVATAEEEDGKNEDGNNIKAEETAEFEDCVNEEPSIDIKGTKTVDEQLDRAEGSIRSFKTEEENSQESGISEPDLHRQRVGSLVNTKIIFKISNIRSHPKNTDPFTKMIDSLPSEIVKKSIGQSSIFGRGENVDIYLHDLLSSRKHLKLNVLKERRGFIVEMTNVSETKGIKLNGSREISPNDVVVLDNNDQVTVGCFTFLAEIVQGDSRSKEYELKFIDIFNRSSQIAQPTESRVLYSRPALPIPDLSQVGVPYGYNHPPPHRDMYQGMQTQGQFPYYMPEIPRMYAQNPYAPFHMQRMNNMNSMPGYPYQQQPQQDQYQQQQYQMYNQQMANMSLHGARMPREHDDLYGTQVTENSIDK